MRIRTKLAALCAFFVIGIAVAACGSSVPGNSVASMAGNPITVQAFNHWMYVAAKQEAAEEEEEEGETVPVIVPEDPPDYASCIAQVKSQIPSLEKTATKTLRSECASVFSEYKSEVMDFLIEGYWYQAQAHKVGITATNADIQKQLASEEKEEFPTDTQKQLKSYLSGTGETLADLKYQVRISYLYDKLLKRYGKKVTTAAIAAYYKSHLSTFGTKASADLHLVRTTTQAKAQAAYAALQAGTSWDTVATDYSADASGKKNGGLLTDVTDGEEEHVVNSAIFAAGALNKIQGPLHGTFGWYVIEVTKVTAATQESLKKATPTIKEILESDSSQDAETALSKRLKKLWGPKTQCQSIYAVDLCTNYKAPATTTSTSTTATTTTATTTTATTSSSTATSTTKTSTTSAG